VECPKCAAKLGELAAAGLPCACGLLVALPGGADPRLSDSDGDGGGGGGGKKDRRRRKMQFSKLDNVSNMGRFRDKDFHKAPVRDRRPAPAAGGGPAPAAGAGGSGGSESEGSSD
jgi:hypothetical protein